MGASEKFSQGDIDPLAIEKIPAKFAYQYKLIPVKIIDNRLVVAMANPRDLEALDDLRLLLGSEVEIIAAGEDKITKAIRQFYGIGAETMEKMVEEADPRLEVKEEEIKDIEKLAGDASIIQFVNQIILEAYRDRATDIHIEPFEDELKVRYRIDGLLHETSTPPAIKRFQAALISRIKIMADLNIAEKRLPQDGRIRLKIADADIDIRVSIVPTLFGESVDLRLLPSSHLMLDLEELGLSQGDLNVISSLITTPYGIILETGPTGCGKTTTLYACLSKINSSDKKIITIEDPIEYQLKGVNQIQVKPKIDLTFANGLRSILRQDPDVIMIGEIRDLDTARIAIRASLTGHLVFSTLHTNDAPGAITRLIDMGIEPYLVSSSLKTVIAQRLVRLICPKCKESYKVREDFLAAINYPVKWRKEKFWRGRGCEDCRHTGYKGRTAIYELLIITEQTKNLILEKTATSRIKQQAIASGMRTLRDDGWEKVHQGLTSIEEVLRVTHVEEINK